MEKDKDRDIEKEDDGTLITLLDEDGNEQEFEHLASLEYNGSDYVALVPYYSDPEKLIESDGELVILKTAEDENGEQLFSVIEDDKEFSAVADRFRDALEDEYELDDEDEPGPDIADPEDGENMGSEN